MFHTGTSVTDIINKDIIKITQGGDGRKAQEGGDICILIADSL